MTGSDGADLLPAMRFISPEDVTALAALLKRSGTDLESQIRGPSMVPTLPHGTRIRIQCETGRGIRPGQVVAFLAEPGLVAHRMVARQGHHILTRGDASAACDPPTQVDRVLGVVDAWFDGTDWRPVAGPPSTSLAGRFGSAFSRAAIRVALAADPRLARRVAMWGFRVQRRLRILGGRPT